MKDLKRTPQERAENSAMKAIEEKNRIGKVLAEAARKDAQLVNAGKLTDEEAIARIQERSRTYLNNDSNR